MSTQLNAAAISDILFCQTHQRFHPTEHNLSYCFGTDTLFPLRVYRIKKKKRKDDKIIIPFSNEKEPHRLSSTMASHKGKLGGRPFVNSEIQHWINFLQSGTEVINVRAGYKTCLQFGMVVPCIWFEIRINYQLDAIEYVFTLSRHISGLHAHLQEQWML